MPLIGTDQLGNQYTIVIDSTTGAILTTPVSNVSPSTSDNSISQTALALISSCMRLIKVWASGQAPNLSEANDALMVFNQMLDAWNADRLTIFTTSADDYALVPGKQVYTLGPGGDFNTNRPAAIDSMSAIVLNNPANPVEVPISMYTVSDWQTKIPVKNVIGSFPLVCYDTGDFPLRSLNMWPIPNVINNVRIYSWQPLNTVATLQARVSYPPGYAEAFRYNLALRLNGEFDGRMSAGDMQIATNSLARIKTMNAPDMSMQSDIAPVPTGYNYRADQFGLP